MLSCSTAANWSEWTDFSDCGNQDQFWVWWVCRGLVRTRFWTSPIQTKPIKVSSRNLFDHINAAKQPFFHQCRGLWEFIEGRSSKQLHTLDKAFLGVEQYTCHDINAFPSRLMSTKYNARKYTMQNSIKKVYSSISTKNKLEKQSVILAVWTSFNVERMVKLV